MKKYYIYTLNSHIDNSPLYVGVTRNISQRLSRHKANIKNFNTPIYRYYRSINTTPIIEILEVIECCNLREAQWQEDFWIEQFLWYGFKLLNVSRVFDWNQHREIKIIPSIK